MNLIFSLLLTQTCHNYLAECRCYPAVPFEGYKIHLVEKCDDQESAYSMYGEQTYDTQEQCDQAILVDADCQGLK